MGGYQFETDGPGGCYSACAFSFLGGTRRIAPDRSLGVHQHFIETALSVTAADFSDVQMVEGLLADYVLRMGVDARFLVRASTTAPNEIYAFTSDEMGQFTITWNDLEYTDWRLEASQSGLRRLILEVQIPPSLRASDNNWLPDGKTPAWYLHDIQFPKNAPYMVYDPTGAEWKSLTPEERQRRRVVFEVGYRASFGTEPTYTADGNPVVPKDMPDLGGLSAWDLRYEFAGDIPGTNFLTYFKLVGRNCTDQTSAEDAMK